jgi:hypothetical protein
MMIKLDILSRYTGEVKFTAEIDCAEDAPRSLKIGLAVEWAVKNNADFSYADFSYADFSNANLSNADFSYADFSNARLWNADFSNARLGNVNLSNADLMNANLSNANLRNANLRNANLRNATGLNDFVKCIQVEGYSICYTSEVMQIGCERHQIAEWRDFDDRRIAEMDGKKALKLWRKYKDWIFQTIDLCPAKPTNGGA